MRRFCGIFALTIGTLAPSFSRAGTSTMIQPGSLWAAWLAARTHNPQFQEARARLAATRTRHPAALAGLLPRLSLDANRAYTNAWSVGPEFYGSSLLTVEQSENISQSYWTVTFTQPLFDWSAIQKLAAANADVAAAAATYDATRMSLIENLVKRYLAVRVAQSQLAATLKTAQAFAIEARQARDRHQSGLRGIIGFEEAQSAEASAQAEVIGARRALSQALSALAELTGPSFLARLPARPQPLPLIPLPPLSLHEWVREGLHANPTVLAARLRARSAHIQVSAARGGYWPSVRLQLSHTRDLTGGTYGYAVPGVLDLPAPAANTAQQNFLLLNLHWNFYAGGGTDASVDRAEDEAALARGQAERAVLKSRAAAEEAFNSLHADFAEVRAYEESALAARRAVVATEDGVKAGLRSEFDLVNARLSLLSAETNLPAVHAAVINDALALESTAGLLTPQSLLQLSRMLESTSGGSSP
ncbi:MAG: TolC family protein [Gammaproteobacteria bacterium]